MSWANFSVADDSFTIVEGRICATHRRDY